MLHPHGTLVGGQSTPIFSPFSKFGSFLIIPSYVCRYLSGTKRVPPTIRGRCLE